MKKYNIYTLEKGLIETNYYRESYHLTRHRVDGPAVNVYYNGLIEYVEYWFNGQLHRLDGPAVIRYTKDGDISAVEYYINGRFYSKTKYENTLLQLKVSLL